MLGEQTNPGLSKAAMNPSCSMHCKGASCVCNQQPNPAPSVRRSARLARQDTNLICIPNYKPGLEVKWKAAHEKDNPTAKSAKSSLPKRKQIEVPLPINPIAPPVAALILLVHRN